MITRKIRLRNLLQRGALLALFLTSQATLGGQTSPVLESYIQAAFSHSPALREKQWQAERGLVALEEAKRLNLPDVRLGATYTLAEGGRDISIPVGDLLNPVYSTLNELTQSTAFPQIQNVQEQFLPDNFYDVRFRVQQPLINPEIRYNREIKTSQASLKQIDIQLAKRELVKEVKTAYFRYLQSGEAVRIYENAIRLLEENRRTNESLLRNDKIIPAVLTRTETEIASVKAQLAEARKQQSDAAAYFNYLLGQNLDTPIAVDSTFVLPAPDWTTTTLHQREELDQLAKAREINQWIVKLEESYRMPNVGLQLDLGSQNFDFKWGGYAILGLSVDLPLWSANRNKLQVQQAILSGRAIEEQTRQVEDQIRLQVRLAQHALQAELDIRQHYETRLDGARRFYRDTYRRYQEGVANYIELLDARTQLTNQEIRQSIAHYNVLIRQAELERALGSYRL